MKNSIIRTIKSLFPAIAAVVAPLCAHGAITGQWKTFSTFDNSVNQVVDTPERVYFTGYPQSYDSSVDFKSTNENSLFYYDKEGDEIIGLSKCSGLSSTSIREVRYNGTKNYLVVLYNDMMIDFITSDGIVHPVPALKSAQIPGSKEVNSITFYPKENLAIFATAFGYISIDDDDFEVVESRNYDRNIQSAARFGDRLMIVYNHLVYQAPAKDRRSDIGDYTRVACVPRADNFLETGDGDTSIIVSDISSAGTKFHILTNPGDNIRLITTRPCYNFMNYAQSQDGWMLFQKGGDILKLNADNTYETLKRPADEGSYPCASWNNKDFYTVAPRKGLRSSQYDKNGGNVTITKDWSLPNAPTVYISRAMVQHPRYGLLVNNYGVEGLFQNNQFREEMLLCGYKNGLWTPLSAAYRNTAQQWVGYGPRSIVVDPDDDKYVYTGSAFSGITRTNLDDPQDVLHMTNPSNSEASKPGYVKMHDDIASWKRLSSFNSLCLDADNVMWSNFNTQDGAIEFWYWLPEDRKASRNASSFRPWKKLQVRGLLPTQYDRMLTLKAPSNRGLLLLSSNNDAGRPMIVYNHNNTLDTSADDNYVIMNNYTDADGGQMTLYLCNVLHEDQDTGTVWIGNNSGIFYFQPRAALQGQNIFNRVKVSRNDGTQYADYLLDGVSVTDIAVDSSKRKWFGTLGAGIVVTSSDGRTILGEFTADNSQLPSNDIYFIQYNKATNSMMISTGAGLAELSLSGNSTAGDDKTPVRAYPNPVAPDYYGWVTIDGMPDNSLVKVVDSEGNIVRELGRAEGGTVQWDVLNLYGKRARTGVYYILTDSQDTKESYMTKILIMN